MKFDISSYLFDIDANFARQKMNNIEFETFDTSVAGAFRSVGMVINKGITTFEQTYPEFTTKFREKRVKCILR